MKLKEYIAKLQELEAIHGDLEVVYLSDSEPKYVSVCEEPSVEHRDEQDFILYSYELEEYSPDEYQTVIRVN